MQQIRAFLERSCCDLNCLTDDGDRQSPIELSETGPTPYRHILSGCGGTFLFEQNDGKPKYIGFSECDAGVSVFFRVDDKRCFAAHISTAYDVPASTRTDRHSVAITGDPQHIHAALKHEIFRRLDAEGYRSRWGWKSRMMRESLVMAGNWASRPVAQQRGYVGKVVADAVQEWLEIPQVDWRFPEPYGGLAVKYPGKLKAWDAFVPNPDVWEPVDTGLVDGEWWFDASSPGPASGPASGAASGVASGAARASGAASALSGPPAAAEVDT